MAPQRFDFHFARLHRGDKLQAALARHKHYLFGKLGLKPGMRVLEVGCQSGMAALELFHFAGVNVIGIENDLVKINEANCMASNMRLLDQLSFASGDLERLSECFQPGSFHAIFSIESLRYSSSFEAIYRQFYSLLKPGGRVALYEWCWTDALDPQNHEHRRLAEIIESSTMIGHRQTCKRSIKSAAHALKQANFRVVECVDRGSISVPSENSVHWYAPLEVALGDSEYWAQCVEVGHRSSMFGGLSKEAATVLLYAGKYELFTPMAMLVGERL